MDWTYWLQLILTLLSQYDWVKIFTAATAVYIGWNNREAILSKSAGAVKKTFSLVTGKKAVTDHRPDIHAAIRLLESYAKEMKCPKLRKQCEAACADLYPLSYRLPSDKPEDSQ